MFVLKAATAYSWPVKFSLPLNGGKYSSHEFNAEFSQLPQLRIDEIRTQATSGEINDDDIVREVFIGWGGVTDENGNDLPFNEATKKQLLQIPGIRTAIIKSFFDSLSGVARKN